MDDSGGPADDFEDNGEELMVDGVDDKDDDVQDTNKTLPYVDVDGVASQLQADLAVSKDKDTSITSDCEMEDMEDDVRSAEKVKEDPTTEVVTASETQEKEKRKSTRAQPQVSVTEEVVEKKEKIPVRSRRPSRKPAQESESDENQLKAIMLPPMPAAEVSVFLSFYSPLSLPFFFSLSFSRSFSLYYFRIVM